MSKKLLKDNEWKEIDGRTCKIISFDPLASKINGKVEALDKSMPYASITFECEKESNTIEGYITNKTDFINLWSAFKERTISEQEEVIFAWTTNNYKNGIFKFFSLFLPKLIVMICPKESFKLMTNQNFKPELHGEARYLAQKPIIELKPPIMN